MTDVQAGVEQVAHQPFGKRLDLALRPGGVQDHQIDVGIGGHFAAAITPLRHQRGPSADRLMVAGEQIRQSRFVQIQHHGIDQVGQADANLDAGRAGIVLRSNLARPLGQAIASSQQRVAERRTSSHESNPVHQAAEGESSEEPGSRWIAAVGGGTGKANLLLWPGLAASAAGSRPL